jgi:hypothetical protein
MAGRSTATYGGGDAWTSRARVTLRRARSRLGLMHVTLFDCAKLQLFSANSKYCR